MRRSWTGLAVVLVTVSVACHREPEMIPLIERTIYTTDRFYDVQAVSKDRAIVVGYAGKIIETTNGGRTWQQLESGVEDALFSVYFADEQLGWVTGQDGLILHTADGGKSWTAPGVERGLQGHGRDVAARVPVRDHRARNAISGRSATGRCWSGAPTAGPRGPRRRSRWRRISREARAWPPPTPCSTTWDSPTSSAAGSSGSSARSCTPATAGRRGPSRTGRSSRRRASSTRSICRASSGSTSGTPSACPRRGSRGTSRGPRTAEGPGPTTNPRWRFRLLDPLFDLVEFDDDSGWAIGAAGEVMRREPGGGPWRRAKMASDLSTWLRALDFSDPQHGWMVGGFGLIFRTTDGGATWLPSQG
jgi:hypothetical protein